jgi:hypothetical protein
MEDKVCGGYSDGLSLTTVLVVGSKEGPPEVAFHSLDFVP